MTALTIMDADGERWTAVGLNVSDGSIVWVPADTRIATFDLGDLTAVANPDDEDTE